MEGLIKCAQCIIINNQLSWSTIVRAGNHDIRITLIWDTIVPTAKLGYRPTVERRGRPKVQRQRNTLPAVACTKKAAPQQVYFTRFFVKHVLRFAEYILRREMTKKKYTLFPSMHYLKRNSSGLLPRVTRWRPIVGIRDRKNRTPSPPPPRQKILFFSEVICVCVASA